MDDETRAELDRLNEEVGQMSAQIVAIWKMFSSEGARTTRHLEILYDNLMSSDEKVAALLKTVFPTMATTQQQIHDIINAKPED